MFYKRLVNLQHEFARLFANSWKEKTEILDWLFSFWKIYGRILKQAENVSNMVFCLGKKCWWNFGGYHLKMSKTFRLTVSPPKTLVIVLFWHILEFLVFLKVSGPVHVSDAASFVTLMGVSQKNKEKFCPQKNSWEGPFGDSGSCSIKNYAWRGSNNFSPECFCLTVPKMFVGNPSCVSESFYCRKTLCMTGVPRFIVEIFNLESMKIFAVGIYWCVENTCFCLA